MARVRTRSASRRRSKRRTYRKKRKTTRRSKSYSGRRYVKKNSRKYSRKQKQRGGSGTEPAKTEAAAAAKAKEEAEAAAAAEAARVKAEEEAEAAKAKEEAEAAIESRSEIAEISELKQKQTTINEAIALLTNAVREYEKFCRAHPKAATEIQAFKEFKEYSTSKLTEALQILSLDTGTNATIPSLRAGEAVTSAAAAAATDRSSKRQVTLSWINPVTGKFPKWMGLEDRPAKYVLYLPPDPSNLTLTNAQKAVINKLPDDERDDVLRSLPVENSDALKRLIYANITRPTEPFHYGG